MKLNRLCIVILVCIAASRVYPADIYSLSPAASEGISMDVINKEIIILARPAGHIGGASVFKLSTGFSPEHIFTWEYGQRDAGAVSDSDSPVKIISTADRGYALLVELKAYTAPRAGIKREAGICLIKLSSAGKQEWTQVYSDNSMGFKPFDVIQTDDKGYMVTGSTMQGNVWKSLLIRADANGAMIWKKSIPSASYASFDKAVQVPNGGFFLYGYDDVQNRANYWLAGTNAKGEKLWQKTWPGMGDRLRTPIAWGPDGSFSGLIKSENSIPKILTFTEAGNLALDNPIAGMKQSDMLHDYVSLADGSLIFCGWTQNSTSDILIHKTGPGNKLLWRKTIHVEGDDMGLQLVKTEDPGYLLIATTGYSYDYSTTAYTYSNMIIKIDENGNKLWSEPFSIGKNDSVTDAVVTADNRCAILITTIRKGRQEALLLVTEPGGRIGLPKER